MDEKEEINDTIEKRSKSAYIILVILVILIITVLITGGIAIKKTIQDSEVKKIRANTSSNETNTRQYTPQVMKPIIYIYPTEETEVEVTLGNPQYLSCTYPKYENSWKVTAKPNGDLIDKETGRNLYALYWEGENIPKKINMQEGYCVKGEDTAKFLEEKLAILGLNEREAEEFIIYWLPQMEDNKYNYIRFETMEEQEQAMALEITPKPDNIIRIMMDWKSLDEPIEVQEQTIQTPSRNGYTVVEWGGFKIE